MVGPRSDLVVVDAEYWRGGGGGEVTSPLARQMSSNDDKLHPLPDAGKGPAVCSSLHCGTRYLIYSSTSTPDCSGAPLGGERFREVRFDSWAILAYWCTLLQGLLGRAIAFGSVKYRVIALPGPWPWARDRKKQQQLHPKIGFVLFQILFQLF